MTGPGGPISMSSISRSGRELRGGAREEHLVGQRQLGAGDVALNDLVAEVARDLDHRLAVDAVEDAR